MKAKVSVKMTLEVDLTLQRFSPRTQLNEVRDRAISLVRSRVREAVAADKNIKIMVHASMGDEQPRDDFNVVVNELFINPSVELL